MRHPKPRFIYHPMEETLIILKPDCMENRFAGEVISRFEKAGFEIVASKVFMCCISHTEPPTVHLLYHQVVV